MWRSNSENNKTKAFFVVALNQRCGEERNPHNVIEGRHRFAHPISSFRSSCCGRGLIFRERLLLQWCACHRRRPMHLPPDGTRRAATVSYIVGGGHCNPSTTSLTAIYLPAVPILFVVWSSFPDSSSIISARCRWRDRASTLQSLLSFLQLVPAISTLPTALASTKNALYSGSGFELPVLRNELSLPSSEPLRALHFTKTFIC